MGIRSKTVSFLQRFRVRVRDALRPLLPAAVRRWLRQVDRGLDPLVVRRFRRSSGYAAPIPPRAIRERVAVEYVSEWPEAVRAAEEPLHAMLERAGKRVEDFERLLDFGCGGGKVIGSLHERGGVGELNACDTHEPSVEWVNAHYAGIEAKVNGIDPPAPYPDEHFDLIWAWSVITHLSPERQQAWIGDWVRMLKPGGYLLLTYNSVRQVERWGWDSEGAQEAQDKGVYYRPIDLTGGNEAAYFAGNAVAYGDTINTRDDVLQRLLAGVDVEVVDVVADAAWGNQDCLIVRKP